MRVARPNVAVGSRLDFHGADGDRVHARLLSERRLAARVGRSDDIGRLPLREPQRLERERRRGAGGPDDEERHAADDLIVIGQPVRGAQSSRRDPPKRLWARQQPGKTPETARGRRPPRPIPPLAETARRRPPRPASCQARQARRRWIWRRLGRPWACSPRPARVGRAPVRSAAIPRRSRNSSGRARRK